MHTGRARQRLLELWGEICDLGSCEFLLEWDQETTMPSRGAVGRASALSTIAGLKHDKLTAPELGEVIEEVAATAGDDAVWAAQAREARRPVERARRVPAPLAREIAAAKSAGLVAWQRARSQDEFVVFAPQLSKLLELKREEAAAVADGGRPYDALLDDYEPGATEASLLPLFAELEAALAPLLRAVTESGVQVDESPAQGSFPVVAQRHLALEVAEALGFDFAAGRLDASTHPFCLGIHAGDVRLTWRWQDDDFRPGLFGVVHETGHGLYEQGLPERWARTPLGESASLGIHESQSRLWENQVGRSRSFWHWALPRFRELFPGSDRVTVEKLFPALHTVRPSLIRVEADEATYNLHVLVRFDLERRLFAGTLEVPELPVAWDDAYERLLGIRPPSAATGVLQDIHWAMAGFGYFPSYTLGTLASAQLFAAARRDVAGLEEAIALGEFTPLLSWLRRQVHDSGRLHSADELIRRATGEPLSAEPFLSGLRAACEEVYGVTTS